MMITPGASPQAGRFQLVWAKRLGRLQILRLIRKIYTGEHLQHPQVYVRHARHVKLSSDPPAYVEAEGELIGQTPIDVKVYPAALRFAARKIKRKPYLDG
jgi:diacylglycerol kinase (ATP)